MSGMETRIDFTQPQGLPGERLRRRFGAPREIFAAHALDEVRAVLEAVEAAARAGQWCLGFVRYGAPAAVDPARCAPAADGRRASQPRNRRDQRRPAGARGRRR